MKDKNKAVSCWGLTISGRKYHITRKGIIFILILLILASGCATTQKNGMAEEYNPNEHEERGILYGGVIGAIAGTIAGGIPFGSNGMLGGSVLGVLPGVLIGGMIGQSMDKDRKKKETLNMQAYEMMNEEYGGTSVIEQKSDDNTTLVVLGAVFGVTVVLGVVLGLWILSSVPW